MLCFQNLIFREKLVGNENFFPQVKDKNEYKFEPAKIVRKICAIYVHLASSDKFCAAVSRDGRSYSPQLFEQAASVLGSYTTARPLFNDE